MAGTKMSDNHACRKTTKARDAWVTDRHVPQVPPPRLAHTTAQREAPPRPAHSGLLNFVEAYTGGCIMFDVL